MLIHFSGILHFWAYQIIKPWACSCLRFSFFHLLDALCHCCSLSVMPHHSLILLKTRPMFSLSSHSRNPFNWNNIFHSLRPVHAPKMYQRLGLTHRQYYFIASINFSHHPHNWNTHTSLSVRSCTGNLTHMWVS